MAATFTLSGNLRGLLPASGAPTITGARVMANISPNDAVIDTTGKTIHLGDEPLEVTGTGAFEVDLTDTDATDLNVAAGTLRFQIVVDYTDGRMARQWRSGWFAMTAAADIADPGFLADADPIAVASASAYLDEFGADLVQTEGSALEVALAAKIADEGGLQLASSFDGDLNTLVTPGTYEVMGGTNLPAPGFLGIVVVTGGPFGFGAQMAFVGGRLIMRTKVGPSFSGAWAENAQIDTVKGGAMVGTGSPEGAKTASPGQRYIDTSKTNGALEWIKVSGSGNTGWRVTQGDTGWRDVSAGLISPFLGAVGMRRINEQVYFTVSNLRHTATAAGVWTTFYTPPTGFWGSRSSWAQLIGPSSIFWQSAYGTTATGGLTVLGTSTSGGYSSLVHVTDQAWPTSLPGTAA